MTQYNSIKLNKTLIIRNTKVYPDLSPITTLEQETRWAYSSAPEPPTPSPHAYWVGRSERQSQSTQLTLTVSCQRFGSRSTCIAMSSTSTKAGASMPSAAVPPASTERAADDAWAGRPDPGAPARVTAGREWLGVFSSFPVSSSLTSIVAG